MNILLLRSSLFFYRWKPAILSDDLTHKSATELVALIRSRVVSPVEVAEAHLKRIEDVNPSLNAIVTIADDVIDRAREAEDAINKGREVGPLHGLPITIKDTIETKGLRTTSGTRLRRDYVPDRDATVVARLKAAGAIVLGKTNVPEMAIPYECDNPIFKRTNNPRDATKTPGGSSGGEAAAIAAHMSPAGVGSDLSGSIRVPAHFCGIAGLKPTTGRIPIDGHVPEVIGPMTLGACIGPMARSVDDVAFLYRVMTAQKKPVGNPGDQRGAVTFYVHDGVAPVTEETEAAVRAAVEKLIDAGYDVREEQPPALGDGSRLWVELFSRVSAEQLRDFYRGREDEAGPLVASIIHRNAEDSSFEEKVENAERLAKAVVEREHLRENLLRWMKDTPLIIAPVGSVPAFPHGAKRVEVRGESISVFRAFSYSQTFNVFGLPAVAVPVCRTTEGLPIGVQVIGRPFAEEEVLAAARIIEAGCQYRER
jgi:Asp-tRNA(Asn)/Glu-tRNA(Gln) amidotransferase A subunit family amidase